MGVMLGRKTRRAPPRRENDNRLKKARGREKDRKELGHAEEKNWEEGLYFALGAWNKKIKLSKNNQKRGDSKNRYSRKRDPKEDKTKKTKGGHIGQIFSQPEKRQSWGQ